MVKKFYVLCTIAAICLSFAFAAKNGEVSHLRVKPKFYDLDLSPESDAPFSADVFKSYRCQIASEKQVYDGDTINDVRVKVFDFDRGDYGEVWAGVFVDADGVYVQTDIRVNGIDTPEKRVSTKNPDGSQRSEVSRERERKAADASRQALVKLLKANDFQIVLSNPIHGKYAGRTVADVRVGGVDVAAYLIGNGHAIPYAGGTKVPFDIWYKRALD